MQQDFLYQFIAVCQSITCYSLGTTNTYNMQYCEGYSFLSTLQKYDTTGTIPQPMLIYAYSSAYHLVAFVCSSGVVSFARVNRNKLVTFLKSIIVVKSKHLACVLVPLYTTIMNWPASFILGLPGPENQT